MTKTLQILILTATAICFCGCSEPVAGIASDSMSVSISRPPAAVPAVDAPRPESAAVGEPTGELTLQTALALALLYNPQLKSDALDIRIAEAERLQASLRPNPELAFEIEELGAGQRSTLTPAETTLALSQLIELGGKHQKRTRVGQLQTQLAAVDYEARRLDVLTEVHTRFVDLLAAQQRARIMTKLRQTAQEAADAVETQVEAGKDSPLEKTRARIQLSGINVQAEQAGRNLQVAREALAALWSADKPRFDTAVGSFEVAQPIVPAEALIERIENNPDIARWAVAIEQRQAAVELEKARAVSDLTLAGGVQWLDETSETAPVFAASIALPLFDTNQGGRLAAAHRLAKANFDAHAARIRVETSLREARMDAANALTRIEELRDHVLVNAQSLFNAMNEGYRAGKFDYLDLLDAQNTLSTAALSYVDALASYHKARAEMERLIGGSVEQAANPDGKE